MLALLSIAIVPVVIGIDRVFGREVVLIAPHDASMVRLNRTLFVPGDPVAEIYGNPIGREIRVVVWSERGILSPREDRALSLLPVGDSAGRPLQVQTLYFAGRTAIVTLLAVAGVLIVSSLRRRHPGSLV